MKSLTIQCWITLNKYQPDQEIRIETVTRVVSDDQYKEIGRPGTTWTFEGTAENALEQRFPDGFVLHEIKVYENQVFVCQERDFSLDKPPPTPQEYIDRFNAKLLTAGTTNRNPLKLFSLGDDRTSKPAHPAIHHNKLIRLARQYAREEEEECSHWIDPVKYDTLIANDLEDGTTLADAYKDKCFQLSVTLYPYVASEDMPSHVSVRCDPIVHTRGHYCDNEFPKTATRLLQHLVETGIVTTE